MAGIEKIPLRIPREWSAAWFDRFIREVLALADIRNAIQGAGITIDGTPSTPATISASADINNLLNQSYVLAEPSAFLPNERILAGQANVVSISDGGPGDPIVVGLEPGGITPGFLADLPALSVLGRPQPDEGQPSGIASSANDTLLRRVNNGFEDVLEWGGLTLPMASDGLWTYAKIEDATALSVLGRTSNTDGALADIVAGSDGDVLRRAGAAVGFGAIPISSVTSLSSALAQLFAPTYLTEDDETGSLPNARQLLAGTNVTFDVSVPGELTVSASGGGGGGAPATLTYLTEDDETADLPNSLQLIAGTNVTFDTTTPNQLVIAASGGGGATGANPTALVGPTATNGVATTFLRSDGAPAIDLTASYTWTGSHVFNSPQINTALLPDADGGANIGSSALRFATVFAGTFADGSSTLLDSSGATARLAPSASWTGLQLGNSATTVATFAGGVVRAPDGSNTAPSWSFSSDGDNGMYLAAANTLGFASAGTLRVSIGTTLLTSTLPLALPDGSATNPSLTFASDPNTGVYSAAADVIGYTVGGTVSYVMQSATFRPSGDATRDLGASGSRFKDLYISGGVFDNGDQLIGTSGTTVNYAAGSAWTGSALFASGVAQARIGVSYFEAATQIRATGTITPAALSSGSTNDYNPTGLASAGVIRLTADTAGSVLSGMAGGTNGRLVLLMNLSAIGTVQLPSESGSSSAANRWAGAGTVLPYSGTWVWYDGTSSRWRIIT